MKTNGMTILAKEPRPNPLSQKVTEKQLEDFGFMLKDGDGEIGWFEESGGIDFGISRTAIALELIDKTVTVFDLIRAAWIAGRESGISEFQFKFRKVAGIN